MTVDEPNRALDAIVDSLIRRAIGYQRRAKTAGRVEALSMTTTALALAEVADAIRDATRGVRK